MRTYNCYEGWNSGSKSQCIKVDPEKQHVADAHCFSLALDSAIVFYFLTFGKCAYK